MTDECPHASKNESSSYHEIMDVNPSTGNTEVYKTYTM